MSERTHYAVLGVTKEASPEAIKKAYRDAAAELHPDKLAALSERQRDLLQEEMKAVNGAYAVLSDPPLRGAYDLGLGIEGALSDDPAKRLIQRLLGEVDAEDLVVEGARAGVRRFKGWLAKL